MKRPHSTLLVAAGVALVALSGHALGKARGRAPRPPAPKVVESDAIKPMDAPEAASDQRRQGWGGFYGGLNAGAVRSEDR